MFPAILSRSFWKIACAQSPNTASSEHLNERVWTKDVSKRKSEMASIYHLPIPKHRFQKHSEYVVNLDKVSFRMHPIHGYGYHHSDFSGWSAFRQSHTQRAPWLEESKRYLITLWMQKFNNFDNPWMSTNSGNHLWSGPYWYSVTGKS